MSGTGRSGTSMWMQLLHSAGLQIVGEAFPRDWAEVFAGANPRGFFESTLGGGINFSTNPDPATGARLHPVLHRDVVVKVFLTGLPLTERAYLHRVLVSVRPWRDFCASVYRADALLRATDPGRAQPRPHLRWWIEHIRVLVDAEQRGYALRFVCYDRMLSDPHKEVRAVQQWLGVEFDVDEAARAVAPQLRTQQGSTRPLGMPEDWEGAFDRLHGALIGERSAHSQVLDELQGVHAAVHQAALEANAQTLRDG